MKDLQILVSLLIARVHQVLVIINLERMITAASVPAACYNIFDENSVAHEASHGTSIFSCGFVDMRFKKIRMSEYVF